MTQNLINGKNDEYYTHEYSHNLYKVPMFELQTNPPLHIHLVMYRCGEVQMKILILNIFNLCS